MTSTSSSSSDEAAQQEGEKAKGKQPKAPRKFKVYTKTGDKGTSSLYSGERASKDDRIFAALGDTDELNAHIGVAREHCQSSAIPGLDVQLAEIQSRLLDLGSSIATPLPSASASKIRRVHFAEDNTERLESWIDAMDEELPPLRNFILPSGGLSAAHLHVARTVCRRAERSVVPLVREETTERSVHVYLNRLSDYLFTAARYAALREGKTEVVYKKARAKKGEEAPAAEAAADSSSNQEEDGILSES